MTKFHAVISLERERKRENSQKCLVITIMQDRGYIVTSIRTVFSSVRKGQMIKYDIDFYIKSIRTLIDVLTEFNTIQFHSIEKESINHVL